MSEWINVNDALPTQPGQYLVLIVEAVQSKGTEEVFTHTILLDVWTGKEWVDSQFWCPWIKITYWMPLPEIPKEQEK